MELSIVHALALPPPRPSPLPPVADDADALPVTLLNVAILLLPLPLPLLPIALRQLPVAEEWELQNESYVSKVVFCEAVPTDVTGPGAVGMSNVLLLLLLWDDADVDDEDGRKDEGVSGAFGGCADAAGGSFCGGAGERGRLDGDEGAVDAGGAGAGVDAGLSVGAVGKAVWEAGGKVESGADRSGVGIPANWDMGSGGVRGMVGTDEEEGGGANGEGR